jgi:CPA2 family monovalent cation:H+ antiporter-2
MLGYLAVGVLIGPNAMALAQDSAGVQHLAEFGVVFLMFVIGLEFNLPKLQEHARAGVRPRPEPGRADDRRGAGRQRAAGLGLRARGAAGAALAERVALGGALAMSSTAIVVKLMAERLELDSEHGRA